MQIANKKRLYQIAFGFSVFTILYNIAEGFVATYIGYQDKSMTLFGFGVDSFIEVISGLGVAHMVLRVQNNQDENRDGFEKTALRITGYSFYTLTIGLVFTSAYSLWIGHRPTSTFWGVIIALISMVIMSVLLYGKTKVGKQLQSPAILADAECTLVCIYLSAVLLISSGIYALTKIPYTDTVGTLLLAYFAFKEGKECFQKANYHTYPTNTPLTDSTV